MMKADDLKAGDIVEITRANQHGGDPITYQSELYAPHSNSSQALEDGLGRIVRDSYGGRYSNNVQSVKLVKRPEVHNFYMNADRAPVKGDVYLTSAQPATAIVVGGLDAEYSMPLDWCLDVDSTPHAATRTLIWDAKEKRRVD